MEVRTARSRIPAREAFVTEPLFEDRRAAGIALAEPLIGYAGPDDVMILALPRGGIPVARGVARALSRRTSPPGSRSDASIPAVR